MSAFTKRVNVASGTAADYGVLKKLLIQLAAVGLAGCLSTAPVLATSLESRALKALFPGTFEAVVNGYAVSFTAHKDGSLVVRYAAATDIGRWSIKQGQLCITLPNSLSGRTICAPVVQDGHWYRVESVQFRRL